jgi:LysR family nitrogen assimilation transcriptional regulator
LEARALRYFQTVAEFGSYSRAAEFLRISQPAISRQVARLEQELGAALFLRHGHGVSLTGAGQILLERAQVILRQIEQTRAAIREGGGPAGVVTLAVPPAAGHYLVPALAARLAAALPNVFLKIVSGYSGYIDEWLVRGRVDLACLHDPLPQRGFAVTPLVREEVFLVGQAGRFPFRRDHARIADLARVPLILPGRPNASRRLLDAETGKAGISPAVAMEVDDPTVIRALLKQGAGCSLLTRGSVDADLRLGELQAIAFRPRMYWRLAMVRSAEQEPSAAASALGQMIVTTARELTEAGAWPGLSLLPESGG